MNNSTTIARSLRYAWLVVALLFPVALLNYLDRQMLATMKSSMVGEPLDSPPDLAHGLPLVP